MSILITGGAGFIGSHVAEALLARGERRVVLFDEFNDFYDPRRKRANVAAVRRLGGRRLTVIEADVRDARAVGRAVRRWRPRVIVHLAARAGVRPSLSAPLLYEEVNGRGTLHLLEAARSVGVPHFVFASSSSVYGNSADVPFREDAPADHPASPYGATKRAGELYCSTYHDLYGLTTTCLRFFTVYGPRQRPDMAIHKFARLLAAGRPIPMFGDGSTRRDYTWVGDIVQGVLGAIDRPHGHVIVNLGESRTTTLKRLISLLADSLGVKARIDRRPLQPGDVCQTYADISRARRLLGYRPTTPIEEGIPRFVEWYRAEGEGRGWRD